MKQADMAANVDKVREKIAGGIRNDGKIMYSFERKKGKVMYSHCTHTHMETR